MPRAPIGRPGVVTGALLALVGTACGATRSEPSRLTRAERTTTSITATTTVVPSTTTTVAATTTSTASTTTTTAPIPGDPASLAAEVAAVETALRDPATPVARLPALGQAQQVVYRRLAVRPDLLAAVLGRLPAPLRSAAEANATAIRELVALAPRRTEPPRWRVRPPQPAEQLLGYYREAEAEFGVPWRYLAAIHLVETHMGRIRSASSAGAQGPMQFMPATWAAYGRGDINSDHDAILAAGRYLRANGAPDRMAAALYRYNPSNHYVRAISAYAGQIRDERAYLGYYHWQVMVLLVSGDVVLPEGYGA